MSYHIMGHNTYKSLSNRLITYSMFVEQIRANKGVLHLYGLWNIRHFRDSCCEEFRLESSSSPRGMLEPWALAQGKIKKRIALFTYEKIAFTLTDRIHVTGSLEEESVKNIAKCQDIVVLPNMAGADYDQYDVPLYSREKNVIFISRLHKKKGLDILLNAWGNYDELNQWSLTIIGEGEDNYTQKITELQQSGCNIIYLGGIYTTKKYDFLARSSCLVLPTYSENYGNIIAESLSVGTPVITTNTTPWSVLEDYNAGRCVDLERFIEILINILENKTELVQMSKNAMSLYQERLQKSVLQMYCDAYHFN